MRVSNALGNDPSVPLRSAEDGKVFAPPEDVTFTLQSMTLNSSGPGWKPTVDTSQFNADGSLVFRDGMITEMDLSSSLRAGQKFSFSLNEPVVLRPEGDPGSNLAAVGTVKYNAYTDDDFVLWVTPQFGEEQDTSNGETIDMKAEIDLPDRIPIEIDGSTTRVEVVLHYSEDDVNDSQDLSKE